LGNVFFIYADDCAIIPRTVSDLIKRTPVITSLPPFVHPQTLDSSRKHLKICRVNVCKITRDSVYTNMAARRHQELRNEAYTTAASGATWEFRGD